MITIRIPTPLRQYAEGEKEVEVQGGTIGEALSDLADQYPAMKSHLYDEGGSLRPYVNVFLNQEDARHLQGADSPIQAGDRLMIVPSIAGGNRTP